MIDFPVNYYLHRMQATAYTLKNLYDVMAANITGGVSEVLIPARSDKGSVKAPWLNKNTWYVYDNDVNGYVPVGIKVGSVELAADLTENRYQSLQNKTGTIALLDDVYGIRDTVILPDGATGVDWDKGTSFKCVIKRTTYFHMQHSRDGMEIRLLVVNNGTDNTVIWDDSIKWPKNITPVMPPSSPAASASILVTLRNISGNIYAEYQTQNHSMI